jgi:hypothetical protein
MDDNDIFAVKRASLDSIRRYLQLKGWHESSTRSEMTSLFTLAISKDDTIELPLPTRRDFSDADRLLTDALRTLSQLDDREVPLILDDINAIGFDRIRSIIPDELVRSDTIDLNIAGEFISRARQLITTTATTELEPSAFFGRVTREAVSYTDRCRFGHTFRGSFGFTIESPIVRNDEPSLSVVDPVPPFERRVVQRLVRGFNTIKLAEISENPSVIAENFRTGFNANMCDALLDLLKKTTDRLKFEIAWSPEWQPASDISQSNAFAIKPSTVELVQDAARSLRRVETARNYTVVGKVIRLKSEHNPADLLDLSSPREVVLQWNSADFGLLNVKMVLSPPDYIIALEAHRLGQLISVSGQLERIGRSWILSGPGNVKLQSA